MSNMTRIEQATAVTFGLKGPNMKGSPHIVLYIQYLGRLNFVKDFLKLFLKVN